MEIKETVSGNVTVLAVMQGRIDMRSAVEIKRAIAERAERGQRLLVIDLSNVSFVDSTGLGSLVASMKLIGRDGELVVCGLNDSVTMLFKLTRMDTVFRTFGTSADAVAALDASRS